MKETYNLDVFCKNCENKCEIKIPLGIAPEEFKCPNCGLLGYLMGVTTARIYFYYRHKYMGERDSEETMSKVNNKINQKTMEKNLMIRHNIKGDVKNEK